MFKYLLTKYFTCWENTIFKCTFLRNNISTSHTVFPNIQVTSGKNVWTISNECFTTHSASGWVVRGLGLINFYPCSIKF